MKTFVWWVMMPKAFILLGGQTSRISSTFKVDYPDFKTFKLEQNYRSTSNIVNLANSLIIHNKKQIEKEVWTKNQAKEKKPLFAKH